MVEHMKCYSELEHLFYRVYPALRNFPVSEKYSLCAMIKENFLESLRFMSLASSVKSKRKQYLQEAEASIQHLCTLLRFSRNQKYLNKGFFEEIDLKMTEIKKMLSGWIKSTLSSHKESSESLTPTIKE